MLCAAAVLALGFCVPLRAATLPSRLTVTFSDTEVSIGGMTPRGKVALVGLAREPLGFQSRVTPFFEVLEDMDGDGVARYEIKNAIAWKSVWGVVDLRTGDYTVAHPARSPGRRVPFKGNGLGKGANGKLSKIQHAGQWLQLFLVRPSGDVFQALVIDGGPLDEDGRNDNLVNVSTDVLGLARGTGGKPDEARAGDILFVVDPDELTMVAVQVK